MSLGTDYRQCTHEGVRYVKGAHVHGSPSDHRLPTTVTFKILGVGGVDSGVCMSGRWRRMSGR
eukprot:232903-Prorocentrum_minimum.AAC.1